ncbi:hypothetical protein HYU11_03005 [Candidatus Woesearchaeota archaeon]|nr:hypothetical protein [Candidatus Woesearchaeota archaeon]
MVYDNDQTTARVFKRTKPLIRKAINILSQEADGKITEAVVIEVAIKDYLMKKR